MIYDIFVAYVQVGKNKMEKLCWINRKISLHNLRLVNRWKSCHLPTSQVATLGPFLGARCDKNGTSSHGRKVPFSEMIKNPHQIPLYPHEIHVKSTSNPHEIPMSSPKIIESPPKIHHFRRPKRQLQGAALLPPGLLGRTVLDQAAHAAWGAAAVSCGRGFKVHLLPLLRGRQWNWRIYLI